MMRPEKGKMNMILILFEFESNFDKLFCSRVLRQVSHVILLTGIMKICFKVNSDPSASKTRHLPLERGGLERRLIKKTNFEIKIYRDEKNHAFRFG
jgi:hypothetical protein